MFSVLLSMIKGTKQTPTTTIAVISETRTAANTMGSRINNNEKKRSTGSQVFMVPSSIHHICSGPSNMMAVDMTESIVDVSRKIMITGELPKLQVVQKDGLWFTLNNAQLDLCRFLEKDGKCPKVKVDIVPLTSVPRVVRGMMLAPGEIPTTQQGMVETDQSRMTTKGYARLDQSDGVEEHDPEHVTDSEDEYCESSDFGDSDSECDWSDEDAESSGVDTSAGSDGSQSSEDDERECLL